MSGPRAVGEGSGGLVRLPGSNRAPLPGAQRVGDAAPDDSILLTMVLRRRQQGAPPPPLEPAGADRGAAAAQQRARLAELAGADPRDIDAVRRFARDAGMDVVDADPARRTVQVRTTVRQASAAFGVSLGTYAAGDLRYRGREGDVHLPADLGGVVTSVLGLDDRPQARVHLRRGAPLPPEEVPHPAAEPLSRLRAAATPDTGPAAAGGPRPLWPAQVAQLYEFPTGVDGTGETVGIIELGGGYRNAELATYFARAGVRAPSVVPVSVDGGGNHPGGAADGEVMLDIEVCGAVAPGARIVVYFADPSDRGFFDALSTAVHDTTHAPSVISISWGGPEGAWTEQARQAFDDTLVDAAALGITVFVAAGDHGSGDAGGDAGVHVDFPAASPNAVGCGGTTLAVDAAGAVSEVAWNDGDGWATGGGISATFPVPAYQRVPLPRNLAAGGAPGRGVPDVAGNADIRSGYVTLADGQWTPVGGTSAVAPLFAGLTALLNQALGRPAGALLPFLYSLSGAALAEVVHDVVGGDNAVPASTFGPATAGYTSGPGWDACTGLGRLRGSGLLAALRAASVAAAPG